MMTTMESSAATIEAAQDQNHQAAKSGRPDEQGSARGLRGLTRKPSAVARWKTCLHEAGHAVAGRVLLKRSATAVVYDDDRGAAYLGNDGQIPRTFEDALVIAAGPEAEALADLYAPPPTPPPAPLTVTHPRGTAPLIAQMRESLPDAVVIARWCIRGIENQPDRWAKRHCWIHREAQFFVGRHQQEIVEVAKQLFSSGLMTLPA